VKRQPKHTEDGPTITASRLESLGACLDQVVLFRKTFGESAPLTLDNCKIAAGAGLDIDWAAQRLLKATAWKAYEEARAPAWKAYVEAAAPAWKAYGEAAATAWKAYVESTATAWKAYGESTDTAWKDYEEAKATAFFHAAQGGLK
jgi:hypothetical protein